MAVSTSSEPRKQPQQARSRQTYQRILDASLRILREEGALGFTTTKVAAEAGLSVGSLYQYFPNKQALIGALHDDDIDEGWERANRILDHPEWSARRRLSEITHWFFESEATEAQTFGVASGDMHVFLRDHGARKRKSDLMVAATSRAVRFIQHNSDTDRTSAELAFAADFLVSTVEAVAKSIASREMSSVERRRWASSTAEMLADHLSLPI